MKTSYYTFTTWDDRAMVAGFDSGLDGARRSALIRHCEDPAPAREDKVIDLTAWRAANPAEPEDGEPEYENVEAPAVPAPRARRGHRAVMAAELVSTACVAAVALVLILRILAF